MTPLQQSKLDHYLKCIGRITVDEALQIALESEQIHKACGPNDIAFKKFFNDEKHFLNYAELLELERNSQGG